MFLLLKHLTSRAERTCQKPILSCVPHHFQLNIVRGKAGEVSLIERSLCICVVKEELFLAHQIKCITGKQCFALHSYFCSLTLTHDSRGGNDIFYRHMTSQAVDPPQSWSQA